MGLQDVFAKLLHGVRQDLTDDIDPFDVELWASQMWAMWEGLYLVDMDPVAVFAGGLIGYATDRRTPEAQVVLRALGAVAPEPYGTRARRAGDRLAEAGIPEPSWACLLASATPTVAWLSFEPSDDDGVSVLVGFDGPAGAQTIGIYVDHNLGGIAKDGFAVPATIDEVLGRLRGNDEFDGVEYREIPIGEAAARWREGFEITDLVLEPPITDDLRDLRALVLARLATMPAIGEMPAPATVGEEERDRLLDSFLESDGAIGLGDDADGGRDIDHLAQQVMTFALDTVRGTPLRFSPVMVEIFCLDWAPRKIAADEAAFAILPDLLVAWIRFAGWRRGISEQSIGEAVEAAYGYAQEMIELSRDPANWGPAKTIALGVQQRGIDISDRAALDAFIAEVNGEGGIEVLAHSLVAPQARGR